MQSSLCTRQPAPISRPTAQDTAGPQKAGCRIPDPFLGEKRFYTRYKKAQVELRELRTAQQNVEAFFRKEERSHAVPQQEVK